VSARWKVTLDFAHVSIAIATLDNMKELPVNMANHVADFASQLFRHLSGMNVPGVQKVSYDARPNADTAFSFGMQIFFRSQYQ